jgi:hypothetical protein
VGTARGTSTARLLTCSAARERARRGGYPSQAAARRARDEWLTGSAADRTAEGWTVERWRRGELCGLRWTDIDLDRAVLTIERNRTTAGYQIVEGDPKTPASRRAVALDKRTVQVLRAHRRRQLDQRHDALADGHRWVNSGYIFVRSDGLPINPNYATTRFRKLVERAGLPPVRLHDLRHGAASLAHEAGADPKTLQDLLGHSSIVVTADTYTSVLPQIQRRCADATAQLVLAAARRTRKKVRTKARKNRPDRGPETGAPTPARPEPGVRAQARTPKRGHKPDHTPAPTSHPRDTHRPHRPDSRTGLMRVSAAQTPLDLTRPKGLEPPTF